MPSRGAAALLLAALAPSRALAQQPCQGRSIRSISVQTAAVTTGEGKPFSSLLQHVGDAVTWRTHEDVVRRELRFDEGEPCDPARLSESARVLRAQPYIRSAVITPRAAPGDSVDVAVRTRDEWPLGISVALDTKGPRELKAIRIVDTDLWGRGMLGQLNYDYYGRHAGLVFDVLDRQFMGSRTDAEVVGGRSSVGPDWEFSLRRSFESEYDRLSWRGAVRYREEPFYFSSTQFGSVAQPVVSEGFELASVGRIGRRGRQIIAGLALSGERLYITDEVLAADPVDDSAAAVPLAGRFTERRRLAGSLVLGVRSVRFTQRSGLDAVNAAEDVREGIELVNIVGRTLGHGGGRQNDAYARSDLYWAGDLGPTTLGVLRGRVEGRWLLDTDQWDGVIASADALYYHSTSDRTTWMLGAQGAGGWHMSTPFQVTVGSLRAMRGFGINAWPAGQRLVATGEHRHFFGTVFGAVDVGAALFVDAGRGWAGDAPFGQNSPTLVSAGAGLRLGFPTGSRLTTRVDFAVPLAGGTGYEVRFSIGRQFGVSAPPAADVERSRLPISTNSLFTFQRY